MRFRVVLRYVGFVFLINAAFLFISTLISTVQHDGAFFALFYSAIVAALFGVFLFIFIPPARLITNNEGLLIVVLSWILSCVIGALPYLLSAGEFTVANAWFESVSGYTTTGSSILSNIEGLPTGLLFWRSATHWIGGMGIIVFVLSVLPSTGNVGLVLYRTEVSPLAQENFRQRATQAVRILLTVYVGLTLLETIALFICGMNLFDAVTHSFATVATGGFSPRNRGIASFQSLPIEIVVMTFMVLSGIHFGLLFSVMNGEIRRFWKSTIVRYYLFVILVGTVLAALDFQGRLFPSFGTSLRFASFQIISAGTSTGFATMDTAVMPALTQLLFLFFALQCACAGSTSGGIKVDRLVILGKALVRRIRLLEHPHAVISIRIGGRIIRADIVEMSVLFISVYLGVVFLSTVALTSLGVDLLSAFSGSVVTMGNVGPGLGSVGSMNHFGVLPDSGKWVF
jgi:trk system potassium uptake protein TrkH